MKLMISCGQLRRALEQLLQKHEAYCIDDDVVVKESKTRSGRSLYVITVTNGTEQAVKSELATVAGPRAYCGAGTWVLREEEAGRLVSNAETL